MGNIILLNYPTFSSLVDKIFEVVAFGNADALKELQQARAANSYSLTQTHKQDTDSIVVLFRRG